MAGIPALAWLARLSQPAASGSRSGRSARFGARLLILSIVTTVAWIVAVGVAAALIPDPHDHRHGLAIVGCDRRPGGVPADVRRHRVPARRGRVPAGPLRRRIDAFLITSAACLGGWILVGLLFNGGKPVPVRPLWDAVVITPPLLSVVGAAAFAVVTMLRVARPRLAVSLLSIGSVITVAGASGVVTALLYGTPTEVVLAGAGTGLGVFLMGTASVESLRGQLDSERVHRRPGWHLAGVVVLGALALIVVQVAIAHALDQVALIAGVTTGVTLVLRQWLALRDADKLAMRLSADEISLRLLAYTDALTGVANRRELLRVLNEEATGGDAMRAARGRPRRVQERQ